MQIPVFRKAIDSPLSVVNSSVKSLPPLNEISISQSRRLIYFYRFAYFSFAVILLIAFVPWVASGSIWLFPLMLMWSCLWNLYRRQIAGLFVGKLWFNDNVWRLQCDGVNRVYRLTGAVVCWPSVIILPLSDQVSHQRKYVILESTGLSPADNARLRTWLRVCLKPKN